jgi:Tfp pilus assembly protein PilF
MGRSIATTMAALTAFSLCGCSEPRLRPERAVEEGSPSAVGAQVPEDSLEPGPAVALAHVDAVPTDHLQKARLLDESADLAAALLEARRAAFDAPGESAPLHAVARLSARLGARARDVRKSALAALACSSREETGALLELAGLLLEEGDARGALLEATLAVARDPELAQAYHLRGRARLQLQALGKAVLDFESTVILNPRHAHAYNDLGVALLEAGAPERAIAPLERAAALAPHLAFVHENLGIAFERAGLLERAREQRAAAAALGSHRSEAASIPQLASGAAAAEEALGTDASLDEACPRDPLWIGPGSSASRLLLGLEASASARRGCD